MDICIKPCICLPSQAAIPFCAQIVQRAINFTAVKLVPDTTRVQCLEPIKQLTFLKGMDLLQILFISIQAIQCYNINNLWNQAGNLDNISFSRSVQKCGKIDLPHSTVINPLLVRSRTGPRTTLLMMPSSGKVWYCKFVTARILLQDANSNHV